MSSKIFALSTLSLPGAFERTRGSTTLLDCRGFRRTRSSTSTPRRISSLTDFFSRAAVAFSSRYRASGMSTVVRILTFCHIYGSRGSLDEKSPMASFFQQIQCPLQFQFQLSAFRQVDFVASARFDQVGCECGRGRPFHDFLLIFVLHAFHRAHGRPRRGGLSCRLLSARPPFDQSLLLRA